MSSVDYIKKTTTKPPRIEADKQADFAPNTAHGAILHQLGLIFGIFEKKRFCVSTDTNGEPK